MELFWRLQARETLPRQTQRRGKNTLTATAKPFLQHRADNQKVLAAGGGGGGKEGALVLKANGA